MRSVFMSPESGSATKTSPGFQVPVIWIYVLHRKHESWVGFSTKNKSRFSGTIYRDLCFAQKMKVGARFSNKKQVQVSGISLYICQHIYIIYTFCSKDFYRVPLRVAHIVSSNNSFTLQHIVSHLDHRSNT